MRVLLATYDSRGGVEPLLGLAVRLRELGAEVLMCAPPDCAERLAEVGVPLVPFGPPVHTLVHGAAPPTSADVPRRVAEVTAAAFGKIGAAAEGCAAVLASGVMPAVAAARSVAEKQGIWSASVSYCPLFLPSPHHPPFPLPGYPAPPGVTDHQVLDDLNVQSYNALYGPALNANRASAGLPPVGNVRDFIVGDQPWLAADPVLAPWPSRPTWTWCRLARGWCLTPARSRPIWPRSWTALAPAIRARAAAVAGTIRTDGATRAATLLLDKVSRERTP